MDATASLLNRQRLRDLAAELQLEDATLARPGDATAGATDAQIRAACEAILQTLTIRRVPPLPGGDDQWQRVRPTLVGLEQMSWREHARLDAATDQAKTAARATIETFPVRLFVRCRTSVASLAPSLADVASHRQHHLADRLRRQFASDIRSVAQAAARELHGDLLRRLVDALEMLYPLACATDDILRAARHGAHLPDPAGPSASLVSNLAARRQQWRQAADALANAAAVGADASEAVFDAGTLAHALGAMTLAAALGGDRLADFPAPSPLDRFRTAVLEVLQTTIQREWESRRGGIVQSVDAHVAAVFDMLQRDLDEWVTTTERRYAALCRSPVAEHATDAAWFEIREIWRAAGGREPDGGRS